MTRTVLIEDELQSRNALKHILENYIEGIEIVGEASSVAESITLLKNINADLVFMDIHLPDGESFDILDQLDLDVLDFEIIFITAYTEIKKRAFDYFFLQYLTKPYEIDKIEKAIIQYNKNTKKTNEQYSTVLKDILNKDAKLLPIPNTQGIDFIAVNHIIRLEAQRNYTLVICKDNKKFTSSKNIKHYEELLNKKMFFRVHKSHIINLKYLKSIDNEGVIKMQNDHTVPLAKRVKKQFIDSFK